MINFDKLLHAKTQQVFGVDAELIIGGDILAIRCIDRTEGVQVDSGSAGVTTVMPGADLRRSDIDALGVSLGDLDGGELHMNGESWSIRAVQERPTPSGATDGLVTLILLAV